MRKSYSLFIKVLTIGGIALAISNGANAETLSAPVAGRITLGNGTFDNIPADYKIDERFISGIANRYEMATPPGPDGKWTVKASGTAPYKTRLVVVRPVDPSKFNGSVVVEWLNVSGGTDGAPDWNYFHRELLRSGYAYVGVSVQKVGLDGGSTPFPGIQPIKLADPARYGSLVHPGDAYAFDIFTQAGRALKATAQNGILGQLKIKHLLADGESQSAGFMTTYVNGVDPIEKVYDGFLIHSRFGGAAPLDGDYLAGMQAKPDSLAKMSVHIRSDVRVPVLTFISETDLMAPLRGYLSARQADSARIRTWEVAGTAHADSYILAGAAIDTGQASIAELAKAFTPSDQFFGQKLAKPMNAAPQHHYVMQAALSALNKWVQGGTPPVSTPRLDTIGVDTPSLKLDSVGNATGGIRSPWVDVPTSKLSGLGQPLGGFAFLFGSTEPLDAASLTKLYPGGRAEYLRKFEMSLDSAIAAHQILAADKREILALAGELY
jgi:hypothetical protein